MGVIAMNDKERQRKAVFEMVKQGRITLIQASEQCNLGYRQTLRVHQAYLKKGDAGLIHQSRGQRSNRKHPHQAKIIALYKAKYEGFGPTLASEYLLQDGYKINHETLRLLLLSEGLWSKQRKRSPYRQRRERKAQFGELLQIDGSIHDWLGTGQHSCLLNLVDDATGKTWSQLAEGETTRIVFQVLWHWIETYGIPLAIYVDLKTVYVSPKEGSFSHFEMACKKLGIRIIKARSPQAKGRVERNHAVYQDRLVKDLALKNVKTIKDANTVLNHGFIANLNKKFEKPAKNPHSAHLILKGMDLHQMLCWEYTRKLRHDWTFSFQNKLYQVQKCHGSHVKPKSGLTVRQHLNDTISIWYNNEKLTVKAITQRPMKQKEPASKVGKKINSSPWYKTNGLLFQSASSVRSALSKGKFKKRPI